MFPVLLTWYSGLLSMTRHSSIEVDIVVAAEFVFHHCKLKHNLQ